MVTQIRPGSENIHWLVPFHHTEYRRKLGRRIDTEMRVDDAAIGTVRPGTSLVAT